MGMLPQDVVAAHVRMVPVLQAHRKYIAIAEEAEEIADRSKAGTGARGYIRGMNKAMIEWKAYMRALETFMEETNGTE